MKKVNILLIGFIILNIILIFFQMKQRDELLDKSQDSSVLFIKNYREFEKLYGNHASIQFYKKGLQSFLSSGYYYLFESVESLNDNDLEEYYDKYYQAVNMYGIMNKEDFKEIANATKEVYNSNISEITIKKNSCKIKGDYVETVVNIKYDNGQKIKYKYSVLTHNARLDSTKNNQQYKIAIEED